jgi:hypothetical protein
LGLLWLYLAVLVAGTTVQRAELLAGGILLVGASHGARGPLLLARAFLPVVPLLAAVTLFGLLWTPQGWSPHRLLLLDLRVLFLAAWTAWFVRRVAWRGLLSRLPGMGFFWVPLLVQLQSLRRTLEGMRLALRSRLGRPHGVRRNYLLTAGMLGCLLRKSLSDAEAVELAMRSRGLLDD